MGYGALVHVNHFKDLIWSGSVVVNGNVASVTIITTDVTFVMTGYTFTVNTKFVNGKWLFNNPNRLTYYSRDILLTA